MIAIPVVFAVIVSAVVTARTLGDAAGHPVGLGRRHGLHRIDHHQARLDLVDVAEARCRSDSAAR
jgi:hypothetical protein